MTDKEDDLIFSGASSSEDTHSNNNAQISEEECERVVTPRDNGKANKRQKFVNERSDIPKGILDNSNSSETEKMVIVTEVDTTEDSTEGSSTDRSSSSSSDEDVEPISKKKTTGLTQEDLENDPLIQSLVSKLVAKEMKSHLANTQELGDKITSRIQTEKNRESAGEKINLPTPIVPKFKSPSETTAYSPALVEKRFGKRSNMIQNLANELNERNMADLNRNDDLGGGDKVIPEIVMDKSQTDISEFIGKIRREFQGDVGPGRSDDDRFKNTQEPDPKSKRMAEQAVINAEKFKAAIATGAAGMGQVPPVDLNFDDSRDGEFSDADCHVDTKTEMSIAKGGFVEVDKLIPKQRISKPDEGRMEFVHREGVTFLVPKSDKDTQKITNVRKWEQGFKVYAAIYAKHNPHRGAEIWQYIHTINLAASSYHWDNVAYYDFTFRQQMAKYPQRSWGKINNQLWSLAMRDPLCNKSFERNSNYNLGSRRNSGQNFGENCCWRFNRDRCNRSASSCRFEHKCSYCGNPSHSALKCHKKRKHEGRRGSNEDNKHSNSRKTHDNHKDSSKSSEESSSN